MLRRYIKQLFTSLFESETNKIKHKENDIDRQVAKLKQMQRSAKYRQRPRKKETVL
jgi:hypothetical protein